MSQFILVQTFGDDHLWFICGSSVVHLWIICGSSVVHLWFICAYLVMRRFKHLKSEWAEGSDPRCLPGLPDWNTRLGYQTNHLKGIRAWSLICYVTILITVNHSCVNQSQYTWALMLCTVLRPFECTILHTSINIIFFSNSKINILFILTFLVVIFAQRPRRRLTLTDLI